jgi:hypothetical protein
VKERETIVGDLIDEAFALRMQVAKLELKLSAEQKQKIVSIVVAAIFAVLNVIGIDVPFVPTV